MSWGGASAWHAAEAEKEGQLRREILRGCLFLLGVWSSAAAVCFLPWVVDLPPRLSHEDEGCLWEDSHSAWQSLSMRYEVACLFDEVGAPHEDGDALKTVESLEILQPSRLLKSRWPG